VSALAAALIEAQKELPTAIAKDADGQIGTRAYRYLTLDRLIEVTRPILNKHGLAIMQWPTTIQRKNEDGSISLVPGLKTNIVHTEGQSWNEVTPLYLTGDKSMQALGSAITYARRYAWAAALGIAAEEDDGGELDWTLWLVKDVDQLLSALAGERRLRETAEAEREDLRRERDEAGRDYMSDVRAHEREEKRLRLRVRELEAERNANRDLFEIAARDRNIAQDKLAAAAVREATLRDALREIAKIKPDSRPISQVDNFDRAQKAVELARAALAETE
jgi:hypothetical protein